MSNLDAEASKNARRQSFRRFNAKFLEPGSIIVMLVGIFFLCQPWVEILHQYSVLVMLAGLIGFNISVHTKAPDKPEPKEDEFGTVTATIKEMTHG
jgi:hypothetical protein